MQDSSGSAPSPSSSHLHKWPCGSCILLREPSRVLGDKWAQLIHSPPPKNKKGSSYSHLLQYICLQEPYVLSVPMTFPWTLRWLTPAPHTQVIIHLFAKASLIYSLLWRRNLFVVHQFRCLMPFKSSKYINRCTHTLKLPKRLLFQFCHSSPPEWQTRSLHLFTMILCEKKAVPHIAKLVTLVHSKLLGKVVISIQFTQCYPWGSHPNCCY